MSPRGVPQNAAFSRDIEPYVALVEWVLASFPSVNAKQQWLADRLSRTAAPLQLTQRWAEMFGHEEVTA